MLENHTIYNSKEFINKIQKAIELNNSNIVYIHSDIVYGLELKMPKIVNLLPKLHFEVLHDLFKNYDIWMPTFNYEFTTTKYYSVKNSPTILGVLNEYYRKNKASWRSYIPMFSICGNGEKPDFNLKPIVDPFDEYSLFNNLFERNALLLYYGTGITSSIISHYCERISKKLLYRYDKYFKGEVEIETGEKIDITLKYHVRPRGYILSYDLIKMEKDLVENNLLTFLSEGRTEIRLISAKDLVTFWVEKIKEDNFYLLDEKTKSWVIPIIQKLGRGFKLEDFE